MPRVVLEGACQCGNVRVRFESTRAPEELDVRSCACGFCTRHGARAASDPAGRMALGVRDARLLVAYRFALRTADFLLCGRCGIYVAGVLRAADGTWATVNVNVLDEADRFPAPVPVSYDRETAAERVARRRARWTPVVGSVP